MSVNKRKGERIVVNARFTAVQPATVAIAETNRVPISLSLDRSLKMGDCFTAKRRFYRSATAGFDGSSCVE